MVESPGSIAIPKGQNHLPAVIDRAGAREYVPVATRLQLGRGPHYHFTDETCGPGEHTYRVDVLENGEPATLFETGPVTVRAIALTLEQNRPNPFNPSTSFRFYLPERQPVALTVYDAGGRLVTTVAEGVHPAGWNVVLWRAADRLGKPLRSGVYFYRLTAGKLSQSRKMVVLK
jgi:hypothetical protein